MTDGPYKLPEGWRWVRLGEVCEINPKRPKLNREISAPTSFVPMTAVDEISGTITGPEVRSYAEVQRGYRYFQEGDVLFAKITPCMENGKAAIARGLIDGIGFGSTEFHILRPRPSASAEWIWYFVRRKSFRVAAKAAFRGGVGQQRVPQEFLESYLLPLPPLEEQRRIVAKMEALMARVREARRLRTEAQKDAERLMQATLAEVFPCRGAALPQGWRWVRLGDVTEKPQYGYTRAAVLNPIGPKFLRISDIQNGVVDWEQVPYCDCNAYTLAKYKLASGDILFARSGATTGKTFLVRELPYEAVFASYLIRIKVKLENLMPEFAFWFFQSSYYWEQVKPRGAAQPNMNARAIRGLVIPLPPLEEQRRIVAYLDQVQQQVTALKRAQAETEAELKRLEQAILDRAFRGEL